MVNRILEQKSLMIRNNKDIFDSSQIRKHTMELVEELRVNHINSKVVAILVNDSMLQFFITLALWECECNIMYINPLNGSDYCNNIFETYNPEYIICEDTNIVIKSEIKKQNSKELKLVFQNTRISVYKASRGVNFISDKGMIFFTSGTTSVSKAVFRTEKNILNDAMSNIISFDITQEDKVLLAVPFGHVYGLGSGIIPFALKGATLYFAPALLSGRKLKRLIEENGITAIIGSPVIYQEIVNTDINLSKCRLLLSAGSKISSTLFNNFYLKYKKEINNMYGSSETGAIATLYNHIKFDGDNTNCGKPMDTVSVKCNGTKMDIGRIYIKSDSIAEGVIMNNQLHSLLDNEGWYETNDMGYFDNEGCLHLSCRVNEVINICGEKISPKAIESIFEKYYGETVALAETDENGFEYPVVYLEKKDFRPVDMKLELEKKLSKRFMPKKVYIVNKLPRNTNGKIKHEELKKIDKEIYYI